MRGAFVLAVLAVAGPAAAHGPCRCLDPASGPPGTRVAVDNPHYKIVFNPDRADLGIGPRRLWREHHGPAPVVVYRRTWRYEQRPARRRGGFAVPDVPAGRYLVAVYDGGEGGAHYTWERFTVTAAPPPPPSAARPGSDEAHRCGR